MSEPWKCPDCSAWIAPHVTEHRCEPPDAMVNVTSIDPPRAPGTVSAAIPLPPGTVVTCNVSGSVTSERDLLDHLQARMLERANRSWRGRGYAA